MMAWLEYTLSRVSPAFSFRKNRMKDQSKGDRFFVQKSTMIFTPRQWLIIASSFVVLALASGLMFSFGIFVKPLGSAFDWSRSSISAGYSIFMVVGSLSAILMGRLSDRYGARKVVILGTIFNVIALGLASVMNSLWQFYLLIGVLLGLGRSSYSIAVVAYVQRAFTHNRGLATGLAGSGSGLGILLLAPLTGYLISAHGWRSAYAALGVVTLFLVIPAAVYLRPVKKEDTDGPPTPSKSMVEIMKRRPFWAVLGSHTCDCLCHSVLIVHLVPFAIESGIPKVQAATLMAAMGAGALVGRISGGIFADRVGGKWALFISLLLQTLPIPLLLLSPTLPKLYGIAIFVGLGMGGHGTMYPFVTREFYGPRRVGVLFGTFTTGASLGMALGGYMGGLLYDLSGDYTLSFLFSFAAGLISLVMVWLYPNRCFVSESPSGPPQAELAQSAG
jgi:predicted MFS family arabinose efflux permease